MHCKPQPPNGSFSLLLPFPSLPFFLSLLYPLNNRLRLVDNFLPGYRSQMFVVHVCCHHHSLPHDCVYCLPVHGGTGDVPGPKSYVVGIAVDRPTRHFGKVCLRVV